MATNRERLAAYVVADRKLLYGSRRAFARAAGVSPSIIDNMENGADVSYRPATLARVEAELQWTDKSIARTLAGGKPTRVRDPLLAELTRIWPRLSSEARAMLVRLARDTLHSP